MCGVGTVGTVWRRCEDDVGMMETVWRWCVDGVETVRGRCGDGVGWYRCVNGEDGMGTMCGRYGVWSVGCGMCGGCGVWCAGCAELFYGFFIQGGIASPRPRYPKKHKK